MREHLRHCSAAIIFLIAAIVQFRTLQRLEPYAKHVHYSAHVKRPAAMLDVVNFTEARNNLKSVLDKVVDDANVTIIARRDAPNAVVMSLDTYNSIMETAYLLKSPANAHRLARSIAQHKAGEVVKL